MVAEPCAIRLEGRWTPAVVVARRQRRGYVELRCRYHIDHAGRRVEVVALLDAASPDVRLEPAPETAHPRRPGAHSEAA